ncbi:TPA: hypothetical protein ACH3X3_003832 [Trebouxia sp. C0006]
MWPATLNFSSSTSSNRCALSPLVMLRLCTRPATLSRLSKASWWTCCIPATAPPPPTELAMMSTHRRAAAGKLLASGVSHGNIMPHACQSRLSEVPTEQSSRNGKTLSKMMASGLVPSCSVLVLD